MTNNPFAKFEDPSYKLKIHKNRYLDKFFHRLWLLLVISAVLSAIITVVSIVIANKPEWVIYYIDQISVGALPNEYEYCNSSNYHAAACLTVIDFLLIAPFLLILAVDARLMSSLAGDVTRILFDLGKAGRLKIRAGDLPDGSPEDTNQPPDLRGKFRLRPRSAHTFAADLENAMLSPWRYVVFAVWMGVVGAIVLTIALQGNFIYAGLPIVAAAAILFVIVFPLFVGYFVFAWFWQFLVVGYYLRWIPRLFELDIQPRHWDGCGGFKDIGTLIFKMALTVTLPAILLGTWSAAGYIYIISLSFEVITLVIAIATGLLLYLAFWTFFQPLLGFNKEMAAARDKYFTQAIAERKMVEKQLRHLYDLGNFSAQEIQEQLTRHDAAQRLFPLDFRFPVWPINVPTILGFFGTQILPVAGIVIGVIQLLERK